MSKNTANQIMVSVAAWKKYRQHASERNYARYEAIWNKFNLLISRDHNQDRKLHSVLSNAVRKNLFLHEKIIDSEGKGNTLIKDVGELTTTDQGTADILWQTFEEMFVKDDKASDHEGNESQTSEAQSNCEQLFVSFNPD